MVSTNTEPSSFTVHTSSLFDPKQKQYLKDISITVNPSTGLITAVFKRSKPLPIKISTPDVDLRGLFVLPGLVDSHTHIFLHDYRETPALNQTRDESPVERTIRAVNHLRAALLAGYTTYRDLGTESFGDADVHVRNAVNRGLTPGPRLFVATEALASSGGYEIRIENPGVTPPRLSDPCDGVFGVRAGVRRRLGAGADVVKFYADYRKKQLRFPPPAWEGAPPIQFPPKTANPSLTQYTQEEMNAIVDEAKRVRCPVASHAISSEAVIMASRAGVTTVEHGFDNLEEEDDDAERIRILKELGTIYVPTMSIYENLGLSLERAQASVLRAWKSGVKLATGGDTGGFPHGENVRELELMIGAGVPLEEVLVAATLHGWEACGEEWCGRRFGWFEAGCAADIIALNGDVRDSLQSLRNVDFVMKDGRIWKRGGYAIGFV